MSNEKAPQGFSAGYVGEIMTRNGAVAVYFRTLVAARRHTERYYDAWVPDGATYHEDQADGDSRPYTSATGRRMASYQDGEIGEEVFPVYLTSGKISHDPEPYLHPGLGRATFPHAGIGWSHAPRPEFDNHNPILVTIRLTATIPPISWLDTPLLRGELPMAAYAPEHIDHARRVLTKLATLA